MPLPVVHREGEGVGKVLLVDVYPVVVVLRLEIGVAEGGGEVERTDLARMGLRDDPPVGGGLPLLVGAVSFRDGLYPPSPDLRVEGSPQGAFPGLLFA